MVRESDAGGESRCFQVGDSEQVLGVWQGTWVHGLKRNNKIGSGSSKYGGNWIVECFMELSGV